MRAYDYWWGYTMAQIELMTADAPIVRYKDDAPEKHTKRKMDAMADAWAEKHKGKSMKGQKIKLSEWLKREE